MRTLFFTFAIILFAITPNGVQAQTNNSSKTVQQNSNISVSVSDSDTNYQFKARYNKRYDKAIRDLLTDRFGEEHISEKKGWLSWIFSDSSKDEIYGIELASGKVKIQLNKDLADRQLHQKIKDTGEDIKELLSDK